MTETSDQDAFTALDRFFDVLRQEVRHNPELAQRLVQAIGASVSFDADLLPDLFNPIQAADGEEGAFRALADKLSAPQLKTVLKQYNLATPVDVKGKSKPELIDMLYERATHRLAERRN
ncbi:MAG: hypothetical protein AAFX03_08980 [Pseudomonadota bacterium]